MVKLFLTIITANSFYVAAYVNKTLSTHLWLNKNRQDESDSVMRSLISIDEEATLLSAFYGLVDSIRTPGLFCRNRNENDGMPVVFSHELDASTIEANSFQIVKSSGSIGEVFCATLFPSCDFGEKRTVLLIGSFGGQSDPPQLVRIIGDIESMDGIHSFKGSQTAVVPLADGPSIVFAEKIEMKNSEQSVRLNIFRNVLFCFVFNICGTQCPEETKQIVLVTWNGGITKPDTNEIDDKERQLYNVKVQLEDGQILDVSPFAIADLNDRDNNHKLCLDVEGTPLSVSFPAGHIIDPAGDLNEESFVNITRRTN